MIYTSALKYFVEVAHSGSLAKASDSLHVAISAISRQIHKLERDMGTPLFERMPRGMVLTEAGETLARYARRLLLDTDVLMDEISARNTAGGLVRLGCTEGFSRQFMPGLLAQLHQQYPLARFALRVGPPAKVEQWVATGEVDIGVGFSTILSGAVRVAYSTEAPIYALMRPDHPLSGHRLLTLDDLLGWPLAVPERGTTVRQLLDWCCSSRGQPLEPLLSSNNSSTMHRFVRSCDAITFGSILMSDTNSGSGDDLLAIPIDEPMLQQRYLQVMVMKDRYLSVDIQRGLNLLISKLQIRASY